MQTNFMEPSVIMSIRSLELRAKLVVDGFRTGLNKCSRHGFSVVFSEYRAYSPGDDPRFFDWKLFGRTDRSYIRLFEDETNLRCYIVFDVSRSMLFGSLAYNKLDYARTLAASLAWGVLLMVPAVTGGRVRDVADVVGAAMQVGGGPLLALTLAFPALLAGSVAGVVRGVGTWRKAE